MAEKNEDLLEAIYSDLCAGTPVDFEGLSDSSGYSLLRRAVGMDHAQIVRSLLDRCSPVNVSETDHDSPLHIAVRSDLKEMVQLLLAKGADANRINESGETPFLIAVEKRNSKIVEHLLCYKGGVNVDLFNAIREGHLLETTRLIDLLELNATSGLFGRYSTLRQAVGCNKVDIVKLLLDRGYPLNVSETGYYSPLHCAVVSDSEEMVELLLDKGADANRKNERGETPFFMAVKRRNAEIVELFLKYNPDVNVDLFNAVREGNLQEVTAVIDSQGASSGLSEGNAFLEMAVRDSHVDIVKLLLDRGYPVNASLTNHNSPLHLAVKNTHHEMVELLLEKGADVNSRNGDDETPLLIAAEREHLPTVELLLKCGADVNAEDNKGRTPLISLCSCKSNLYTSEDVILEIAKLLINKGAKVNTQCIKYSRTPLHRSIKRGFYSLADFLMGCNADINLVDAYSETALHFAAQVGGREIASRLLADGADVNAGRNDGATALHIAVKMARKEMVELLLANGATVNCVDASGESPFQYLGTSWLIQIIETGTVLLKWGADVKRKTKIGRTALHFAVRNRLAELAEFSLENGAQVNCKDLNGVSPLHLAYDREAINVLMEFGAIVDCRSNDGRTPLHFMSSLGRSEAVATLLEYGADINVKCNRNLTPFDWTYYGDDGSLRDSDVRERYGDDLEISTADARDVLLRHQAKMEGVGMHVEESQFLVRSEGRFKKLRKSCQEEMLLLRSEFINGTSVSYYDFVRKDVRFLARYMDNENVMHAAELEDYKLRSKFPTYASMIRSQFQRGRARNKLIKAANQVLNQLIDLPDYCTEKIMDYLRDDDLAVLITVFDLLTD